MDPTKGPFLEKINRSPSREPLCPSFIPLGPTSYPISHHCSINNIVLGIFFGGGILWGIHLGGTILIRFFINQGSEKVKYERGMGHLSNYSLMHFGNWDRTVLICRNCRDNLLFSAFGLIVICTDFFFLLHLEITDISSV